MISAYSWNLGVKLISASTQARLLAWVSHCQFTWRVIASQQCRPQGSLWLAVLIFGRVGAGEGRPPFDHRGL
jgi:hypothetical protein